MEDYSSAKLKAYVEVRGGVVDLSGKGLSRVPDAVTELTEVEELMLYNNNLTELSTSIIKLKNLIRLHLSGNKLTELPSEIGDLKELRSLNVSYNQLVSLPTSIQKLNQLKVLQLCDNRLTELPSEIGDLKELRMLDVSNNQLVSLPTSIQKLNQLEGLHLYDNRLTELPSEIGDLKELWRLDVSNNQLVSLPTSILKLDQLKLSWLDVSGNPLSMDAIHALEMKKKGMTVSVITGGKNTPSFEQTAETGTLWNAGKDNEVVEKVLPVKAIKEKVVVEPEDKTDVEGKTYVGESTSAITREIVTSEGTPVALKLGAVHLIFHPNAVSEPTTVVLYRWKSSVCSPPLQEHEAIVSNVIGLSSQGGQRLQFNAMVTLSLSHSAPELRGYEVVIKRQINRKTNEWEDVSGTKNLRCRQDIEDERPSHKDIPDLLFPVAQADIYECSTYAVVCRLKSSPPYTITSTGGLFIHPDYPGMTVTVPENAVAPESPFTLEFKVQEVPNKEFEEEGVFLGPILRIKCFGLAQFFRPVTIQLPVSLRDRQDFNPDPTKCHVRVLFLNCEEEKKEWTELTDLVKPAQFDGSFVRIQVQRFSGYSFLLDCRQENSSVERLGIIGYLTRLVSKPRRPASFFAYFRPDCPEILRLICCHTHLTNGVIQDLEKRDVIYVDGSSMQDMIPGMDKAFVFVSGGICSFDDEGVNDIFLRLLEDEFKTELRVRVVKNEYPAEIEFHNTLTPTGRKSLLCKIHLPIQNIPLVARHGLKEHTQKLVIKGGIPTQDELEGLSRKIGLKWKRLGRRLQFDDAQITEHDKKDDQLSEKAYYLLMAWKCRDASNATYRVLNKALSGVDRRDLAQEFCCQRKRGVSRKTKQTSKTEH